ncbi:hypothetical protein [Kosakonia sp. MUSA4]|uniref:hypothetical protein n=1 Tax=Kosakonia sp. MUSA4 TaxID=2067958 RepID=UPI001ABF735D|nr:hypothetical protein [Kosakonia sp. MUSA4]
MQETFYEALPIGEDINLDRGHRDDKQHVKNKQRVFMEFVDFDFPHVQQYKNDGRDNIVKNSGPEREGLKNYNILLHD